MIDFVSHDNSLKVFSNCFYQR